MVHLRIIYFAVTFLRFVSHNYKYYDRMRSGIPYTAHRAQIRPPPLFLIFVYFFFVFRLG